MPSIYVASPLGFTISTRLFHHQILLPALIQAGWNVLDPWADFDPGAPLSDDIEELRSLYRSIGKANAAMIRQADGVLAVLEGTDVDSGTASEVGFAAASGKPIVGFRDDLRQTGERGATVNLQVEYFIHSTGGKIFASLPPAISLLTELTGR